jgi:deazaflavin-dependent oxidoreductase (nitroreductase family)
VLTSEFGVPRRPRWYHNLMVHPVASVEIRAETCTGSARVAHPTERCQWCDRIGRVSPQVAAVVEHTHCKIPVVVLDRIARPA